jgi:hypothetical protein
MIASRKKELALSLSGMARRPPTSTTEPTAAKAVRYLRGFSRIVNQRDTVADIVSAVLGLHGDRVPRHAGVGSE